MKDTFAGYYPLDKNIFLSDNSILNFDIYYSKSVKNDAVPVLLVAQNSHISNLKIKLSQRDYGQLFIRKSALDDYKKFIENSLLEVISDPLVPLDQKAQFVNDCARNVLKQVFEDPRSGENIKQVENVTNNIVRFILGEFKAIPHLLSLSAHNYYTFSHCLQVSTFALGLWLHIGKGLESEAYSLALGCMLHDIGKIRIDKAILNKPEKLKEEEFAEMKKHPEYGAELVCDFVSDAALDVIMHHHERFDGTGYPKGLKENNISSNSKIAAIADVYDAVTTNRAYAKAAAPFEALNMMKKEMTSHFEQEKFESFIKFLGTL